MNFAHHYVNFSPESLTGELLARHEEVFVMLELAQFPVWAGRSHFQADVDIVHPVLNKMFLHWFNKYGWQAEGSVKALTRAADKSGKRVDFYVRLNDGRLILVEVQFGNGGRTHADLARIARLHKDKPVAMAYIITMMKGTAETASSGVATHEEYLAEAPKMEGNVPMCLIGLTREGSETVDLSVVPGIPHPKCVGGNAKPIHDVLAAWVLNGVPLEQQTLPPAIKRDAQRFAARYTRRSTAAVSQDLARWNSMPDCPERDELLLSIDPQLLANAARAQELLLSRASAAAAIQEEPTVQAEDADVEEVLQAESEEAACPPAEEVVLEAQAEVVKAASFVFTQCPPKDKPRTRAWRRPGYGNTLAPASLVAAPPGAGARLAVAQLEHMKKPLPRTAGA